MPLGMSLRMNLRSADEDSVAGIVAALIARHDGELLGE